MKAAFLRGVRYIVIEETSISKVPDDGVLLRIDACGICGSDIRRWKLGPNIGINAQILGHEIAGTIVERGSKVEKYEVGDRVALGADVNCGKCFYCRLNLRNLCDNLKIFGVHYPGGLSEYMILTSDVIENGIIHLIPSGLGAPEAAMAEPVSSVISLFERLKDNYNEDLQNIAIIGAGPIGYLHVEIGHFFGYRIILIGRGPRLKYASIFNPDFVINAELEDPVSSVKRYTGGTGVDVVVVAASSPDAVNQAFSLVRKRGLIIIFGGFASNRSFISVDFNLIHYNEICLFGSFGYLEKHHSTALNLIENGHINASKYFEIFPLIETQNAFEMMEKGKILKAMILPW
jgi:L-iditol 2-dehydrogenase